DSPESLRALRGSVPAFDLRVYLAEPGPEEQDDLAPLRRAQSGDRTVIGVKRRNRTLSRLIRREERRNAGENRDGFRLTDETAAYDHYVHGCVPRDLERRLE